MSIQQYFESGEERQAKGHFSNLIKIANADGEIDAKEEKLLRQLAKNFGITEREFKDMMEHKSDYVFIPPVNKTDRYERFINLLRIVVADDQIKEYEMITLRRLAAGLDLPLKNLDSAVQHIIASILNKDDVDDIVKKMDAWLKGK